MNFDTLINQPCILPQEDDATCTVEPGGIGDRRLILRPEVAVVPVLGNVQYRTFLVANGIEQEVKQGLTYRVANPQIAIIGAIGGNATGLTEGIVTVSVKWQELEAFAQLQVVESCSATSVATAIVIDRSSSMAQAFGGMYGSKLDFAKTLAAQYVGETNVTKDTVGLVAFSASGEVVRPLTDDIVDVTAAVHGLATEDAETDIHEGIATAKAMLDESSADRKVMVLITDCYDNGDIDPVAIAEDFRESGGILMVIALRSGREAFILGEKLASGGFFVSAYDMATGDKARTYVSGLKGYLCAGACCEPPGLRGTGKLNFNEFKNWDVHLGVVDLIGPGLFDLVPGHGLYVDLVGSSSPWQGGIRTKTAFPFVAGQQYRLSYKLAGNQRTEYTGFSVRVIAGSVLSAVRHMNDWRQDFTEYTEEFTGDGTSGQISFTQETIPSNPAATSFGILLDDVKLENLTTGETLFVDGFDEENQTMHPPPCGGEAYGDATYGYGDYGYAYGYDCCYGYGCLTEPIPAQAFDPNPPEDVESEDVEQRFTATQSYTATCPAGTTGDPVTKQATATSPVSAADAAAIALARATAEAEAALVCSGPATSGQLINIDIGVAGVVTDKVGKAAIGITAADVWNTFSAPISQLRKHDGSLASETIRVAKPIDFISPEPGVCGYVAESWLLAHDDRMYNIGLKFLVSGGGNPKPVALALTDLQPGTYRVVVYAHGPEANDATQVGLRTGKITGNVFLTCTELEAANQTNYGIKQQTTGPAYLYDYWNENGNFVKWETVTVGAGQDTILIQFGPGPSGLVFGNGIQLQRVS